MQADAAIFLMAKQPRAGQTKTRLTPPLSPEQAALLYEAMLKDTLALARTVEGVDLAIAMSPPDALAYFQSITRPNDLLLPISGADIGACLSQSFEALFARGCRRAIALNTDGPSLLPRCLRDAILALEEADVVLGPGEDGGYYLIGLNAPQPALFTGIPWSTGAVLSATLGRAATLGLRCALTPPWYDVDTLADALRLYEETHRLPADRLAHARAFFQQHPPQCWQA